MAATPDQIAAWIAALVAGGAALFERLKNTKKEKKSEQEQNLLSDAKRLEERANLLAKLADDNALLFKKEHEEHQKTRDFWHEKSSEFQSTLSSCQEKLQEYSAKPDYTDMLRLIKEQSQTNAETLIAIRELVELVKRTKF